MQQELKYHYVAFLDILGFANMVQEDCNSPGSCERYLPLLFKVYESAREHCNQLPGAKVTQFSDSIVLALPYELNQFMTIVEHVGTLQTSLLKAGILTRGGLSFGKHFSDAEFLFSDALIKAYKIETDRAIYPRVVIDDDLLELVQYPKNFGRAPLVREADGAYFIDYIGGMSYDDASEAISNATNGWQKFPLRVREKLRWLREYAAFTFPEAEHFKNHRFDKQENRGVR